jgi:hypothetical protein
VVDHCEARWHTVPGNDMDPDGVLFSCGQLNCSDRSNSVRRLGVSAAFAKLPRTECGQYWCARLVEGNHVLEDARRSDAPPLVRSTRHCVGTA